MQPNFKKTCTDVVRLLLGPIFFGMLTTQAIATLFVYLSNQRILSAGEAIEAAGFFPIPTGQAMASLKNFGSALGGGLFFTLSIGIGLTLVTWSLLRIWDLLFKRDPRVLIACGVIWMALLFFINSNGAVLFPSLFCIAVPLVTGWATIRGTKKADRSTQRRWYVPVVVLGLLTALWATQLNQHLFTTIRDHILLSNPAGRSVNDFYYRYTLFAAEAIKSFHQKTLRTGRLNGFSDDGLARQLNMRLLRHDVIVLPAIQNPDIALSLSSSRLLIRSPNGKGLDTTVDAFMADPDMWLAQFSRTTDGLARFRQMTLIGLLMGFPILLFCLAYGFLRMAAGWIRQADRAVFTASGLCLLVGVLLFLPMLNVRPVDISADKLSAAIGSAQWTHRVAALRFIEAHNMEIARYAPYQKLLASPLVVERYWAARAMAKSRTRATYMQLLKMLEDPHPNVICQVFYALGERGRPGAIPAIQAKMAALGHWYAQWYGYRALRKLGWYQHRSN